MTEMIDHRLSSPREIGLVFFPAYDWAISPNHPEREERLLYTQDQILEEGLLDIDRIHELKPERVSPADVERVHFCIPGVRQVTTESHFISAGGAKAIGRAVMQKRIEAGFALVRPPGHHAMRVVHGSRGFCNINIEAVMVEYLRATHGVDRVAIVDTDCHHGDGTQDIYWHDPDTLFISIHQDGRTLYPGSGFQNEMGGPNATGKTINIPLPPNTSKKGFLYAVEHIVLPILADFKPDLVINSAGQDNHYSDPITNMNFCANGYAQLTSLLQPDIAVLEGGYSIEGALPYVNLGIVMAMAGLDYSGVREPDYDPSRFRQSSETTRWIEQICENTREIWESRHVLGDRRRQNSRFDVRSRTISYDTDNIMETQNETLKICADCAGVLKIDTVSNRNGRVLAIHIPRKACKTCRDLGYQWFEEKSTVRYEQVFLQDRTDDAYYRKNQTLQTGDRY